MVKRYTCINCGIFIRKSAISDPYMCRNCEKMLEGAEMETRHPYLDKY